VVTRGFLGGAADDDAVGEEGWVALEAANDRDHGIECEPADVSCDGPAGGRFVDVVAEWRAVAR